MLAAWVFWAFFVLDGVEYRARVEASSEAACVRAYEMFVAHMGARRDPERVATPCEPAGRQP